MKSPRYDKQEGECWPDQHFAYGKITPQSFTPEDWEWLREVYIYFHLFNWHFFVASGYYTMLDHDRRHHWRKFRSGYWRTK